MKKRFLVIGIGRLGSSLVRNLHLEGQEVIALDNDEKHIEMIKGDCSLAVVGDSQDIDVLKEVGAEKVDVAIICMGTYFEAAVLTTTNLLELKVPTVAARASSRQKAQILRSVGAHQVFFVEEEMGKVLAQQFSRPAILHAMDLGYDLRLVEWSPAPWAWGRSLEELQLPQKYRVQIVALRDTKNPKEIIFPRSNMTLGRDTLALLMGNDRDLQRLQEIES
ncbi:MAG: TrkA family potassium uptake protein [Bdellovibrionaceae bacterium]|nr:TrkA family potassium uptake protein [Pseudobdellovibrionaceae bacterium]MDW8189870.1 TrkA family potassium uptake protein [Pseudobdellovibrionaceae bacterium]